MTDERREMERRENDIKTAYIKAWEQIQSLKSAYEKMSAYIEQERDNIVRIQEKICELEKKVIDFITIGGIRCAERGMKVLEIEKRVQTLADCPSCKHENEISNLKNKLEFILVCLKWLVGIFTAGIVLTFMNELWNLLMKR